MFEIFAAELGCWLLIWVFSISALNKILAPTQFVESLEQDFHVPAPWSRVLALLFLLAEIACAVLLLTPALHWALVLAVILLSIFSLAIFKVLQIGEPVYCRCFGTSQHPLSWLDLARNLFYLLAAALALILHQMPENTLTGLDRLALAILALAPFLLSVKLHELQRLMRRV